MNSNQQLLATITDGIAALNADLVAITDGLAAIDWAAARTAGHGSATMDATLVASRDLQGRLAALGKAVVKCHRHSNEGAYAITVDGERIGTLAKNPGNDGWAFSGDCVGVVDSFHFDTKAACLASFRSPTVLMGVRSDLAWEAAQMGR